MDEEDQKNKEFLIVGQAFLHTGLTRVENLIQDYINASEQYHDSYSVALLNKIKDDIEKYRNIEDQEINECFEKVMENIAKLNSYKHQYISILVR